MPVQNARISLAAGQWVELTNGDVAGEIVFQNVGGYAGKVQATPDAFAPDEGEGAFSYAPGAGDRGTLADLFPGVVNPVRLWVYAPSGGMFSVQHGG